MDYPKILETKFRGGLNQIKSLVRRNRETSTLSSFLFNMPSLEFIIYKEVFIVFLP